MPEKKPKGTLIIIGGHEDKKGDDEILTEVAKRSAKNRNLVILTVATSMPEEVAKEYKEVFTRLGATKIKAVDVRTRDDAMDPSRVEICSKADVIFFTGGDQLRITSQIGDSPIFQCLHDNYMRGATIVGTSAGAAAMSETMVISGSSDKSHELFGLNMAPGLGFIKGAVIDSHFAERGRIGRLLGAVTQNPKNLGIGIDEDTAMILDPDGTFTVMGSGAIYVVDGTEVRYSNLSEKIKDDILTVFNVKLHVLGKGYRFDLANRQPIMSREEESEKS